ncbi:tyrosine-type recombinase/integrase [Pelagibacterium lacus]|uniref:Site-specific integrase n=1 Tax=Pelagibacterium lacus TaxID=2282655 RepID=A0A369W6P0_9HYPH|nr:site-specific integrase [Pelagibacterium lacus]RDE10356.1 site-specific integrase [Pelagibacterium lacus]
MATITKRRWLTSKGEVREAWTLAYTDAGGKRHKEQFPRKRDADARRIEVEGQVSTGAFRAAAKDTTVAQVVDLYVEHLEGRHARGEKVTAHYLKVTEGQLRNYVAPEPGRAIEFDGGIGEVRLAQLTARTIGEFRDRLRDSGVSVITTRRILGSLSRALSFAVANDLVAVNAAQGVRVIGRRDEGSKRVVPPSKAALALLIDNAELDFKVKLVFAAATGLRASEMHALRWNRVDLDGREVIVDSRVDAYKNLDVTKSEAGTRTVPLGQGVAVLLKDWRGRSTHAADDDLVFPNSRGGFVDHGNMIKRQFNPLIILAAEKAKEDRKKFEPFGWHALRHFAISTWIEAGLTPKTVQTFAGHSTLAVTMDRYGHLFPSSDHQSAMDKIASENFA